MARKTTAKTAPRTTRPRGKRLLDAQRKQAQETFLDAFANCGTVREAARQAGVDRSIVYQWRNNDSTFAARWAIAEADANDVIRAEIKRRAVDGWDEPVYQSGRQVGVVRKYSDTLLRLLAQSRMQEYRDKLDVTSGNEVIGAHGSIAKIISDPDSAALACDLLERIGQGASTGDNASGASPDRQ